jgi:hypothetical protein
MAEEKVKRLFVSRCARERRSAIATKAARMNQRPQERRLAVLLAGLLEPVPEPLRGGGQTAARVADGAEVAGEVEPAHGERVERPGPALGLDGELGEEREPACVESALDALALAASSEGVSSTPMRASPAVATARVPEPASRVR